MSLHNRIPETFVYGTAFGAGRDDCVWQHRVKADVRDLSNAKTDR